MNIPALMIVLVFVLLFFLGASIFSFLNVVIFRVPRGEEFVKTRSHCPGCGKVLTPLELIPVVSYTALGGKCGKCGSRIGKRDVSLEVFGGLLTMFSFWFFFRNPVDSLASGALGDFYGRVLASLTAVAMLGILNVIAFIYIDMGEVQRGTLIALAVVGVLCFFTMPQISVLEKAIGLVCVSAPMLVAGIVAPGSFDREDVLVVAVSGLCLGWKAVIIGALIGVVLSGVYAIYLLVSKQREVRDSFSLIPFLCLSMGIALFVGNGPVNWFLQFWR